MFLSQTIHQPSYILVGHKWERRGGGWGYNMSTNQQFDMSSRRKREKDIKTERQEDRKTVLLMSLLKCQKMNCK